MHHATPFELIKVAMMHHAISYRLIADIAMRALFGAQVDVEDFEDIKSGFKVAFTFAEDNPYFSNRQLVKTLKFSEDATLLATGTRIDWREGKVRVQGSAEFIEL